MKIYACLPAVVKDVLGVDERNNIPLTLHLADFGNMVIVVNGLIVGCNERFLRFFVLPKDDE